MKLYYSPGACSLSPHIILNEGGFSYDLERVDFASKTTDTGVDFLNINPKGYVPALRLDDGQILTEGPAIVQYLADRVPEKQLVPPAGSLARYRLMEWLNFISTELHKGFGALFNRTAPDAWKDTVKTLLAKRFHYVSTELGEHPWLMGDTFSVADAYLFTVLRWGDHVGVDLSPQPVLTAYLARVAARPAVQATLKAEGLI